MKTIIFLIFLMLLNLFAGEAQLDFSQSVIVTTQKPDKLGQKAVRVLQEEIEKKTGLAFPLTHKIPEGPEPYIAIGLHTDLQKMKPGLVSGDPSNLPEGYQLIITGEPRKSIIVAGNDSRGILYGIGKLLRILHLKKDSILAQTFEIRTSPRYPLRGHQLGYRPKTNAYDAWDAAQFDQYIRELALFGANSIEIMPPRTDDDLTSVHMPVPPMEMMIKQSKICDEYGLDVWIWYPNMGSNYSDPDSIAVELKEREEVFSQLKRVDVVFVPGGDPGDLHPDILFAWLKKVKSVLQKYHPQAKIWVSPQAFRPVKAWLDDFYKHVNNKYPWFGGVVFGPWVKTTLPDMRKIVDPAIPIRRYPDITHSISSQYPVRNWDLAYAMTLGRECYNQRPVAEKAIHNALDQYAEGSISYSEGINDDVNKFIWSSQDWDPETPVIETLREYCRLFVHPDMAEDMAQGLLALERNWDGPILDNAAVALTLHQWQDMEKNSPAGIAKNYRFQMGLLRAFYDAYIRVRLINETDLEMKARLSLDRAGQTGSEAALNKAEDFLKQKTSEPIEVGYKERCWEIADYLFKEIGSQTSVVRHQAMSGRGDFMDYIDRPLNDAVWLLWQIEQIRKIEDEEKRLSAIRQILDRANPGPGGFYDNFGNNDRPSRLPAYTAWEEDPGSLSSPRVAFGVGLRGEEWVHTVEAKGFDGSATPLAWMNQLTTLYDTPLTLIYNDLDPAALYSLQVAYTGRFRAKIRLMADDSYPIHELFQTGTVPINKFKIPMETTKDGRLKLTWTCGEGERGTQIAEVWLIRER